MIKFRLLVDFYYASMGSELLDEIETKQMFENSQITQTRGILCDALCNHYEFWKKKS